MIQKRNGLVVERNEWKPCTFERDAAGNVIWRLPDDVRDNGIGCFIVQEIAENIGYKRYFLKYELDCRVLVIENRKSFCNRTHKMKGAYCVAEYQQEMNIINKLHNKK